MKILFKYRLLLPASTQADVAINAQQPRRPPAPQLSREPNIFTEDQEVELGEAVAEHIQVLLAEGRRDVSREYRDMRIHYEQ